MGRFPEVKTSVEKITPEMLAEIAKGRADLEQRVSSALEAVWSRFVSPYISALDRACLSFAYRGPNETIQVPHGRTYELRIENGNPYGRNNKVIEVGYYIGEKKQPNFILTLDKGPSYKILGLSFGGKKTMVSEVFLNSRLGVQQLQETSESISDRYDYLTHEQMINHAKQEIEQMVKDSVRGEDIKDENQKAREIYDQLGTYYQLQLLIQARVSKVIRIVAINNKNVYQFISESDVLNLDDVLPGIREVVRDQYQYNQGVLIVHLVKYITNHQGSYQKTREKNGEATQPTQFIETKGVLANSTSIASVGSTATHLIDALSEDSITRINRDEPDLSTIKSTLQLKTTPELLADMQTVYKRHAELTSKGIENALTVEESNLTNPNRSHRFDLLDRFIVLPPLKLIESYLANTQQQLSHEATFDLYITELKNLGVSEEDLVEVVRRDVMASVGRENERNNYRFFQYLRSKYVVRVINATASPTSTTDS